MNRYYLDYESAKLKGNILYIFIYLCYSFYIGGYDAF
jgi:hypothetical protein